MAGFWLEPKPGSAGKADPTGWSRLAAKEGEGRGGTGRRGSWVGRRSWVDGEKKRKRRGEERGVLGRAGKREREIEKFSIFEIVSNNFNSNLNSRNLNSS